LQQGMNDGLVPRVGERAARWLRPFVARWQPEPVSSGNGELGSGPPEPCRQGLGLSAKLLLLTVLFVMLAEVLIFLPSVANFRVNWLTDRLTAARLASLAADAVPDHNVPAPVRMELLTVAKVQYVAIKQNDMRRLVLPPDGPITVDRSYDLRRDEESSFLRRLGVRFELIADALAVLASGGTQTIRVFGHPAVPVGASAWSMNDFVEIVLPEAPLRTAMIAFGLNVLLLSIIISVIAASFVYLALNRLLVQPILRIADNMERFSRAPENASLIITPSARTDEMGTAERELQHMQRELRSMLNQKNHLAALGLAVSKISHDLRNMLATAQLLSDRLTMVKEPAVQSFAPKLIASLDRAINLCNDTLRYGRAAEAEPRRVMLPLVELAEEVGDGLGLPRPGLDYRVEVDPAVEVDADRDQLYRVLNNLVRNSVQVIEQLAPELRSGTPLHVITVGGRRVGREVLVEVRDSGPGVPQKARANLFRAFQGAARKGGTGLGLAIASELVAAHGGRLELRESEGGAVFRIVVPDR
jgi:signal transduction histidine kinase